MVLVGPWLRGFQGFADSASADAFDEGRLRVAPRGTEGWLFEMDGGDDLAPVTTDPALRIVRAERGHRFFWTDRGAREMASWTLYLAGGTGPVEVPEAVVSGAAWPLATRLAIRCWSSTWATHASQDGITLRYHFAGDRTDWADYPSCRVLETSSAVALSPVRVPLPHPTSRPTGMFREVDVRLQAPVGGRVLVHEDGFQVPLTTDGSNPWDDRRPL